MEDEEDGEYQDVEGFADARHFYMKKVRLQADSGDKICGQLLDLEALARECPWGSFIVDACDYDEDTSDLDIEG